MTLVKFNSEKKNIALLPGFNDIIESVLGDTFSSESRTATLPAVNISQSTADYQVEMAAPGFRKEDFKVSLERDMLSISIQKSEEVTQEDKEYNRREYNFSAFTRSFVLPESADTGRIQASYRDGVLTLSIPKKEEVRAGSRQIEIG
ncbi:Hsp20/alpha crystallin family protein [Pedobacter sp.]|uniref:Hsp20/alpha crystallin family protein n=1 Tax=Pedobacter sp. TaxID=1411316 RepID=UPI003C4D3508